MLVGCRPLARLAASSHSHRLVGAISTTPLNSSSVLLARSFAASSSEAEDTSASRVRPTISPVERRRELFLYKQQVHELRLQYRQEWEDKVKHAEKAKAERAAEFWQKVEAYRKIKAEKTQVRRQIAAETLARLREEKAASKVEKLERHAGWKQTQVEKSRERFSLQLIESRDWSCNSEFVAHLVHESLLEPSAPRYANPTRNFSD